MPSKYIYWFEEIHKDDSKHFGEKGAHLADLKNSGISIPDGFVISPDAFEHFLKENNLEKKAKHLISTANQEDPDSIKQISHLINKYFHEGNLSSEFKLDLYNAYKQLGGKLTDVYVKVIPSISAHTHSTKKDTHKELKGEASIIYEIKDYWASNFSEINISKNKNTDYVKSLIIQKVIEPEKSGKIYTIDPENYDKKLMIIKSMLGHYEPAINLISMPDYYVISKNDHSIKETQEIIQKIAKKGLGHLRKSVNLTAKHSSKKKLNQREIENLITQAKLVEKISYFPQEIDWIIDRENIYLIHTKPLSHAT